MLKLGEINKNKMRKFYLVSAIIVGVLILVMSFAQIGATCSLYLFSSDTPVVFTFLQVAAIGAIFGGLLVLFWKMPLPEIEEEEEKAPTPNKPNTKIDE